MVWIGDGRGGGGGGSHDRQHAINNTSDHTSTITQDNVISADANGLPADSGIAKTDVSDAVTKKHNHANQSELDLVTDGDHDVRTDNPHSVTKSQVGLGSVPNLDTTDAVANEHTHANKSELDLVTDGDHDVRSDNPHSVTKAQVGLGDVTNILDKLDATSAPTVDDDVDLGYSVGSLWIDVSADKAYKCLDATAGAAVWFDITQGGAVTAARYLTVSPSGNADYTVIQTAIDAAITGGADNDNPWALLVYPGTYDEQLTLKRGVDIVGISRESVIISKTIDDGSAVLTTNADPKYKGTVANLTVICDRGASGTPACINITGSTGTEPTFLNLHLKNTGSTGNGIEVDGTFNTAKGHIIGCFIESLFDGIDVTGKGSINIVNTIIETLGADAMRITSASEMNVYMAGCLLRGNTTALNLGNFGSSGTCNFVAVGCQFRVGTVTGAINGNAGDNAKLRFDSCYAYGRYAFQTTGGTTAEMIFNHCDFDAEREALRVTGSGSVDTFEFHKCAFRTRGDPTYYDIYVSNANANVKLFECSYTTADIASGAIHNMPQRLEQVTFTDADTTPSVANGTRFKTANTGSTSITDFDNHVTGQRITLIFGDGNTTLVHNASILNLAGDANFTGADGDIVEFIDDGGIWREVARILTGSSYLANIVEDLTPQFGGDVDAQDNNMTGVGRISFTQELDNGSKTTHFSIDFATDQKQKVTLTANTMTLTLDTTSVGVGNYLLKIVNGGLATLTWASESGSLYWRGGSEPSLTSSGTDLVSLYFDGTDWYGDAGLDFS